MLFSDKPDTVSRLLSGIVTLENSGRELSNSLVSIIAERMIVLTILTHFFESAAQSFTAAPDYLNQWYSSWFPWFTGVVVATSISISIVVYVVIAIFNMKLFAKANVPAWKAWVPIVNSWKFLELGGYPGALCLLNFAAIIPCIGFAGSIIATVFMCMAAYQISLKLGKDGSWVVLYIFLSVVWLGIMAFNNAVWNDSLAKPARGPERPPSWPPYGGGGTPPSGGSYQGFPGGQGQGGYGSTGAYPPSPTYTPPKAYPPPADMYPPSTILPPPTYTPPSTPPQS